MTQRGDKMTDKKQVKPIQSGKPFPRIVSWNDPGTVIQNFGKRHSVVDPDVKIDSPDMLLEIMNANLIHRQKDAKKKKGPKNIDIRTKEDRLRGLFGGRRDNDN